MKQVFEFIPIICFFVTFKMYDNDIFLATGVLIGVSALMMIIQKIMKMPITKMQVISLVALLLFGGITIAFRDEMFLKWKVSVVNWIFAMVFLGTHFIGKTTIIEKLFAQQDHQLPTVTLRKLNLSWVVFFVLVGILNLYVVYNFDTEIWVNFKLFGLLGLTAAFAIGQAVYIAMKTKQPTPG